MPTAVDETVEQTGEDAAKATLKQAQDNMKAAKADLSKARKAATEAAKAAKAASDEDKAAAEAKHNELKDAVAQASQRVDQLGAEVDTAKNAVKTAREADKAAKAEARANRPKKAAMTLSQRRALLKLGDGPITPHTAFNQLPLQHLVSVGLAQVEVVEVPEEYTEVVEKTETKGEGDDAKEVTIKVKEKKTRQVERNQYSLTDEGTARVGELNPKWKTWSAPKAGESATESTTETSGSAE
jgi:small-conductance mechanosensitive channel